MVNFVEIRRNAASSDVVSRSRRPKANDPGFNADE
jgi:hypothetical protein